MNEQALRALWFSIPSLLEELRTLKVCDTRFCFFIIIIVISIIIIIIIIIMQTFFFFSFFWTRATDWTEKEIQLVV